MDFKRVERLLRDGDLSLLETINDFKLELIEVIECMERGQFRKARVTAKHLYSNVEALEDGLSQRITERDDLDEPSPND